MSRRASSKHQYDISDFKVDCRVEYNVIRFDGAPNNKGRLRWYPMERKRISSELVLLLSSVADRGSSSSSSCCYNILITMLIM